ncbi:MAG: VOC family protein [Candidatus Eisenbacteria bacterium]
MPTTTQHAPGTFCWFELATSDQNGARTFYSKLFGYEPSDSPIGGGQTYTILKLAGRDAAALYAMRAQDYPPGMPSHWLAYVAVENADAAAARVKAAGGTVMVEPFDVMEHGRMAACADPLGAAFAVWQPKQHPGTGVAGEHGAFAWCQLNAPTAGRDKAKKFYAEALGWTFRDDPMPMGDSYTTWLGADGPCGGMMPMPPGLEAPAHWLIYFATSDVDATATKTQELGGQCVVPPTDIPGMGRFAVLQDPQGAFFAVVKFSGAPA